MDRQVTLSPRSLVIVGAGDSGIAAAVAAAHCGLCSVILDERSATESSEQLCSPSASGRAGTLGGRAANDRERLLRELHEVSGRVRVSSETAVLEVTGDREVLWTRGHDSTLWPAGAVILATGGSPRVVPFPGWTLPGVVRAGDLPNQPARARQRAVVAGTGPSLLTSAAALLERGIDVVAVLEAGQPPWGSPGEIPKVPGGSELLERTRRSWEALINAGVPIHFHHAVFRAHGQSAVTSVTIGALAPDNWAPRRDRETLADVDLVVTDFGAVSSHELATLAGCQDRYDRSLTSWVPVRDDCMRATVAGIFSIGDGAGVAAGLVAEEEGRIAGITAAEQAGTISASEADRCREVWRDRLRQRTELRELLEGASRIRSGLYQLLESETVVCPCESVALAAIRSAVSEGARDLSSVKLLTRLGMGACQAKVCGSPAEMILACETDRQPEGVGRINPRPPARAVTLGALARMDCGALSDTCGPHLAGAGERR